MKNKPNLLLAVDDSISTAKNCELSINLARFLQATILQKDVPKAESVTFFVSTFLRLMAHFLLLYTYIFPKWLTYLAIVH